MKISTRVPGANSYAVWHEYPPDFFDGVEVPPLVVTVDGDLPGRHRGSVHVEGASVVLGGELQGSLWLWAGADAEIRGGHQGSLHLEEGSRGAITGRQQGSSHVGTGCALEVTGKAQGSMHIDHGGRAVIERRGSHQGSVHNWASMSCAALEAALTRVPGLTRRNLAAS